MNLAYLHRLIFNGSAPSQKGGPVLGKIEQGKLYMMAEILTRRIEGNYRSIGEGLNERPEPCLRFYNPHPQDCWYGTCNFITIKVCQRTSWRTGSSMSHTVRSVALTRGRSGPFCRRIVRFQCSDELGPASN